LIEFRPFTEIDYTIELPFFVGFASAIALDLDALASPVTSRVNFRKIDSAQLRVISPSLPPSLPPPKTRRSRIARFA
jgi:hypothetical protein